MEKIDFTNFKRNIRNLRLSRDLAANELSKLAGFPLVRRVTDLENAIANPKLEEIVTLAKIFEVSIDDLLFKETVISVTFDIKKGA
jgi:transcriptional regulator with XRE-family HTH domain